MNDFTLTRNPFGQLMFTGADGEVHEGVVPVRAFAITAPDEGSLASSDGVRPPVEDAQVEDDAPRPLGVYGLSKRAGEMMVVTAAAPVVEAAAAAAVGSPGPSARSPCPACHLATDRPPLHAGTLRRRVEPADRRARTTAHAPTSAHRA